MTVGLTSQEITTGPSDPLGTYANLSAAFGADRAFLMESLGGPESDNRFSMSGLAGRAEVVVRRGVVTLSGEAELVEHFRGVIWASGLAHVDEDKFRLVDDESFWQLPRALSGSFAFADCEGKLSFSLLTFFGYDAARYIEQIPRLIDGTDGGAPDAVYSLVDTLITHHEASTDVSIVNSSVWSWRPISDVVTCLAEPLAADALVIVPDVPEPISVTDDVSEEDYLLKGQRCLQHIRIGNVYQVQLGHSITVKSTASPFDVYRRLRWRNPSPYMALIRVAGSTVVCASPELFIRTDRSTAVMRPIAGTASRGGDEEQTRVALSNDPKEMAEHLMLVDLCRNDLGRFARPGSINTTALMTIEEYSHVFHIVSEVECNVSKETDVYDIVKASFPAGTMTGAPKVRAMEVIESLESSRRGFYAGAFGLISLNGRDSVLGLAIRMTVHIRDQFTLRASAGFVADSTPSAEWQETLSKLASTYWAVAGEEIR